MLTRYTVQYFSLLTLSLRTGHNLTLSLPTNYFWWHEINIRIRKRCYSNLEVFLHDPGDLGGRFLNFVHHEKQLLRESFKVALKKIREEEIIVNFFHRFRFFHLETFWYDDRYWKSSPGSTLHDSNDGLVIFDILS